MKTVTLALPLLLVLLAVRASADDRFITPQLEHDWQMEYPRIQTDIVYANFLLEIRRDDQFNAAVQHRFWQMDQESLANYNRGVISANIAPTGPGRPEPISVGPTSPGRSTRSASPETAQVRVR